MTVKQKSRWWNYRLAGEAVTIKPSRDAEFIKQPRIDDDLYNIVDNHQPFEFEWRSISHPFDTKFHQN